MTEEQPLYTYKEIAPFLRVGSEKTARKICKKIGVPFLEAYLPRKAVLPSTLLNYLKRYKGTR